MLRSRWKSFGYAWQGIRTVWHTQPNFKIHVSVATLVLIVGWRVDLTMLEWCILIGCMTGVMAAEAFNSALEFLTDLVSPEYHTLAGKCKDAAAGAVLLMAMGSVLIGLLIFLPKLSLFFNA